METPIYLQRNLRSMDESRILRRQTGTIQTKNKNKKKGLVKTGGLFLARNEEHLFRFPASPCSLPSRAAS